MSAPTHKDPSQTWLIFFFVCFTITVGMIGLWACFSYKVDDGTPAPAGGHHGMIQPHQIPNPNPTFIS
ncbi:MAG: hypothetical protein JST89_11460 [Cyanobacteria bacterium SZAS-4]|nr:hypothetical protein [Cyanobacteria bacterium SZAS-4]